MSIQNLEFDRLLAESAVSNQVGHPRRRVEYSGGFKMKEHKPQDMRLSGASTQLDKESIYSKLGYNFTNDQPEEVHSLAESSGSYTVTVNRREVHNCKFAPSYKCNIHNGTLKLPTTTTVVPVMPRTKKQYPSGGDIVCFYYEPNDGNRSNVVVINRTDGANVAQFEKTAQAQSVTNVRPSPQRQATNARRVQQSPANTQQVHSKPIPVAPLPSEILEYKHRYKNYIASKRDQHYLALLLKIIEKIDFQRFQCTSPNEQRKYAQWKGKFRPRVLVTMAGLVSYYHESDDGRAELRKYLYLFVCQGDYDIKSPYEVLADKFVDGFRKYMQQKKQLSHDPEKALNKLNFRKIHEHLRDKLSKRALCQFLAKMSFISLALKCTAKNFESTNEDKQIGYEEYETLLKEMPEEELQQEHIAQKQALAANREELKKSIQKHKASQQPSKPLFKTEEQIDRMKITVVPHELLTSEQSGKLTIRQLRLLQDEEQRKAEQNQRMHYRFKARQVPKAVRNKDLYQSIIDKNEQRRSVIKQQSLKRTQSLEKPFSFYFRDQNKKKQTMDNFYHWNRDFRARSVPKLSKTLMYDRMLEQQRIDRELNLQARQQQMLKLAHYPASMSNLANYKQQRLQTLQVARRKLYGTLNNNQSYYKEPPRFDLLHREAQESLERRKMNFTNTKPMEFRLSSARPMSQTVEYMKPLTGFIPEEGELSPKKRPYVPPPLPKYVSASTLKFDAMIAKRRQDDRNAEMKKLKAENDAHKHKMKEQHHKQELLQRLADNLQEPQHKQKQPAVPKQPWSQRKNHMVDKVYEEGPLLIERHYVRKNGKKVEQIVQAPKPSDKFRTIL